MKNLERLNSNEKLLDGNDVLKKHGLSLDGYNRNHQEYEREVKKVIVEVEEAKKAFRA